MKSLILALLIFSTQVYADSALTNRLRKNEAYNNIYSQVGESASNTNLDQLSAQVTEAYEHQKKIANDPSARAQLYYQEEVTAKPCPHCPKYLDLVLEVNKIVEKTKVENVQKDNEKMIALTKLKFLYYTVKSVDEDNNVTCQTFDQMLPGERKSYTKGKLNLAAEEALALPGVNSVQQYLGEGKEVHYFYKGEGNEADNVIEVVMMPDGTSTIKYYKYDNGLNLPYLGEIPKDKEKAPRGDTYVEFNPTVKTEHYVLPTDIGFGSMGTKYSITDDLDLKNTTEFAFNKQDTNVSVLDKEGNKYVVIEGQSITDGVKTIDAVVNYDFDLSKESNLKLGTSIGNTTETLSENLDDGITNKQSVRVGITDHDNEYVKIKTFIDGDKVTGVGVGNKMKINDGSVGTEVEFNRDGSKKYKIDIMDKAFSGSAGLTYEESIYGDRSVGVNVGANIDPSLRLSTDFSRSDTGGKSVALNLQKKINKHVSMVLSVGKSDEDGANILYQVEAKF